MIVYRLTRRVYANDLSGIGAEQLGGRWNSKGVPVLYTSSSRALCLSECLVHVNAMFLPQDLVMVSIEIPDASAIQTFKKLPSDWQSFPHPLSTRAMGDEWLKKNTALVVQVPSAIIGEELNYLINPRHPHMAQTRIVAIKDFQLDARLLGI